MKRCDETGIIYFTDYERYRNDDGSVNENFNKKNGGYILDVKQNIEIGINYYYHRFIKELTNTDDIKKAQIITCMPSSQKDRISEGLKRICIMICRRFNNIKYIKCLNRYKTIDKLAYGGDRNKNVHFNSIEICCEEDIIANKNIILLDDVTTTGNSLLAAKKILEYAGARNVECIALAKTKERNTVYECFNNFNIT